MDIDLGPLNILICWQSMVLALAIAILTHGVKTVIDIKMGGSDNRQEVIWVNRVILPGTPLVLGCLMSMFVPLHPDALLGYIKDHALVGGKALTILATYGVVLGQFSDYVWHRFSGIMNDYKDRTSPTPAPPAPAPDPAPPAPAQQEVQVNVNVEQKQVEPPKGG